MVGVQKRKIRWVISLLLAMLYFSGLTAQAQYGGGTGEPNDPYRIATAEDLMLLGESPEDYDKHFILTADIDLDPNLPGRKVFDKAVIAPDVNDANWWFDGTPFAAVLDGNSHTISNLTITGGDYLGLFGELGSGAEVKDLGVIDVYIIGSGDYAGGLVGRIGSWESRGGVLTNCYSTGTVTGDEIVGGLVGDNFGSITRSYSTCTVRGESSVGGLMGGNGLTDSLMGGGVLTNCYSTGEVSGDSEVGGLVGSNNGNITTSYSTSAVSGNNRVGGLVGFNLGSIITSYSTGTVSGNENVGGLVGMNDEEWGYQGDTITSFWDIETSGQTTSAGGTGLTTAEMQDINIYLSAGWDSVNETLSGTCDYWQISPGDYPRLRYHTGDGPVMPEGLGTAEEPYLIRDARDLGTMWFKPTAHYRLEASVDLTGITWSMAVVPWFGGTFDGNGYVISNLHIQGGGHLGLFGQLVSGAKISNLGLEAVVVNGIGDRVGGLVGDNSGSIATSYSTGSVSVSESRSVGGLVGYNSEGSITTSYSTSTVTVTGSWDVGGLVGCNWEGRITTSYSTGTTSGETRIGGLVGSNYKGSIATSYSTGTVNGTGVLVGGLVGNNGMGGNITTCYSIGTVNGTGVLVGGLVGDHYGGLITTSFWDMETSGLASNDGGTGKTTAEMQTASTFLDAGWDFVDETENGTEDIWSICQRTNYPRLVWQIPAGDFVCPDGITIEDFVFFAEYWRDDNCDISNDYCEGTDLDFSGTVDEADLEILVENWLAGGN